MIRKTIKNETELSKHKLMNGTQNRYIKVKFVLDKFISGLMIIVLAPLLFCLAFAVKLDSRGPILFKQKRVGRGRELFEIYKFRTMKIDTPKDMPTHMLSNPEMYITKVGKFLRKTSLDELPQLFNIWKGEMSFIGPRPALWNQDDLITERDLYGANDIFPGLTGWAQINGRDELEILEKAKLDGEYVKRMSFLFDCRCFFLTFVYVLKHESVIEGGTGTIRIDNKLPNRERLKRTGLNKGNIHDIDTNNNIDSPKRMKHVLITGANSYIGESVKVWLAQYPDQYKVDMLDMIDGSWKAYDFSPYDCVYHVAGIAHADVGQLTKEQKKLYYEVNTRLAVNVAIKAKKAGVKQFIFMSSMIVYGGCKEKVITSETKPKPSNFYGNSKWLADKKVQELETPNFHVAVLRPPMIYGKGCKGNYIELVKLARKLPIFPIVNNKRSMLYIDNLCEFVKLIIDNNERGAFFPQNSEYSRTSDIVKLIADYSNHKIIMLRGLGLVVWLVKLVPGKIGRLANKAFGNSIYDLSMSQYAKGNYRVRTLRESIEISEGQK